MPSSPTDEAARWMFEEIGREGSLSQYEAVAQIEERYGSQLVYVNQNGNPAIHRDVLAAFRRLTESSVVWDRWGKLWRLREADDEPGRKQG